MEHKKLNRLIALAVFLVSAVTYVKTVSPTVVFWDVGEFCAAAFTLQVPHPPGAPLFLLVARLVSMVPYVHDIAVRMHLISAIASAGTILFLYLIIVRFVIMFRGMPGTTYDRIVVYSTAAIGALSLTFNKTFWFNAVEAEVYGVSMLLVAVMVWLALRWYERASWQRSDVYLVLIAYIIGLSVGVHLLAILAVFVVMLLVYFRFNKFTPVSFFKFGIGAVLVFGLIYPGVVKELPSMLDGEIGGVRNEFFSWIPFIAIAAALYGVYYSIKTKNRILNVGLLSFLFIVLGYSTYTMVYIRANAHPPMNENDPSNMTRLVSYLNREQYGSAPLIKRRWDPEPEKAQIAARYSSDWDYFVKYQMYHMYLRYHLWNYVGVAGDEKEAGVNFRDFYAIPLLIGLFGAYWHWRKDWQMAFVATALFLVMGVVLVLYFNMQEPQPRERDYFYVGSFLVFSGWIGIGLVGLIDLLKEKLAATKSSEYTAYGVLVLAFLFVPVNMLRINYREANRSGNYVPWDYSYNLLQSCEKDAILFTNGDNDTFPLWYLQDVEAIRRDIRIVNLSLLNTNWYIKQLKHGEPYGARKVPISTADADIEDIRPIAYNPRVMELPVGPDIVKQFSPESTSTSLLDTSVTKSGVIRFYMPNTLEFSNVKALRAQDIMVYDIVRTSNWQRPIYFAMTVSDDGKIGLREYMQLTGLAFKFTPRRTATFWGNIDDRSVSAHMFADIKEPSKTLQPGFLWRGLQDSTTYFDEDARRLVTSNYRNMFISLVVYYAQVLNQPQKIAAVLDKMEQVIPRNVIPMDYRVKFDIATYYNVGGNKDMYRRLTEEIVASCKSAIDKGVTEQLSQFNPYILLFYCYQGLEKYKEAEDLLPVIRAAYPAQQGIDQIVAQLRGQLETQKAGAAIQTVPPPSPPAKKPKGK